MNSLFIAKKQAANLKKVKEQAIVIILVLAKFKVYRAWLQLEF